MEHQRNALTVLVVVMVVAILSGFSDAQSGLPSCVQQLSPCLTYLNSTATPSANCCTPIKDAVDNQKDCLCNLYNTPGLLGIIGTNVTQILRVTKACGVNADPSICNASAQSPASAPPPVPGTPGGGDSGAGKIATTGIFSLFFIWVLTLVY